MEAGPSLSNDSLSEGTSAQVQKGEIPLSSAEVDNNQAPQAPTQSATYDLKAARAERLRAFERSPLARMGIVYKQFG